ncbi:MAG TPA: hypothetical protein VN613_00470 [Gemmatimonadaceae bacterium]|nr:hypothetical protein [Gemmatimonadaceae bacterium]
MNAITLREVFSERTGGHAADASHAPHLGPAVDWLCRAQDATGSGGIARGYSLVWSPYFQTRGWEPAYPETTGYIVPTLMAAARVLHRDELLDRALRAAKWECEIQMPSGAIQGGVLGQEVSPAIFNTGQVIFGWLAAYQCTGTAKFAAAAERAATYLASRLHTDGIWHRDQSQFARKGASLYNARTAWAMAEAGVRLENTALTAAASRSLHAIAQRQLQSSWFPDCCLTDPERPLLHTLAYAIRGLLEGGRVLGDPALVDHASAAAAAIAAEVDEAGRLPGRFGEDWRPAARWSCLTGEAQMAGIWIRLYEITGEPYWLEPVPRVLQHLKSTQNREADDPGLRGGIKGSDPLGGEYGPYEVLSWATKFFVDALVRHDRVLAGTPTATDDVMLLA